MSSKQSIKQQNSFATLRQFIRERTPVEQCEFCSAELPSEHQHLVEPSNRQLICACNACAVLFSSQEDGKYRKVPKRILFLSDFQMTDAMWESLMIPISMAFFFNSTPAGKVVALYPSPAGATESLLSLESWKEIAQNNPVLEEMEQDVEALLVNRVGNVREHYLAPIDECYKLVGIIRAYWRGLSGGSEVWEQIKRFFDSLKEKSARANDVSTGSSSQAQTERLDTVRSPIPTGGEPHA